jgi:SUMO ligase MMS21 Smc5/6 complex component
VGTKAEARVKHDIISYDDKGWVTCKCGRVFCSATLERAREQHLAHVRLLEIREQIGEEK